MQHKAAPLEGGPRAPARAPYCEIRTGDEGGAHVIHVNGELDRVDCSRLDRALTDAENSPATLVVVNCDELEFIDSAGLHSLLAASKRSSMNGDRLRITRGTGCVAKTFAVSGVEPLLPLLGSRTDTRPG